MKLVAGLSAAVAWACPAVVAASAYIYTPEEGAHIGVPSTGETVQVPYRGYGFLPSVPPGFVPGPTAYSWMRDDANPKNSSGPARGPGNPVYYAESASTRGIHQALMRSLTNVCSLFICFPVFGEDLNTYTVQYLPTAAILSAPAYARVYEPVTFIGEGTVDLEYSTSKTPIYIWNFGDGTTGAGSPTAKTYGTPGTYEVTLTVSDGKLAATDSWIIKISPTQTYEDFVTGYLGYFQLGRATDLEPYGHTANNGFSVSASGLIVDNMFETCCSVGAMRLASGDEELKARYPSSLSRASVEFWMRVDGPLYWHTVDPELASAEVHPTLAEGPGWMLQLATVSAESGGYSGRLRLMPKRLSIISVGTGPYPAPPMIEVPITDFSKPHMITVTDEPVSAQTALASGVKQYGLFVDGVNFGVIQDATPISTEVVDAISLSPISGPFCSACSPDPNPLRRQDQYSYRDAPITYDEAVLYGRIVTPAEVALRYAWGISTRSEELTDPPEPPDPSPWIDWIGERLQP